MKYLNTISNCCVIGLATHTMKLFLQKVKRNRQYS